MARLGRIDSQIRANRLILANRFRVPELKPFFFCESRFGGQKIANRSFEVIRANRWYVVKTGGFLQIALIRFANRRAQSAQQLDGMTGSIGVPSSEIKKLPVPVLKSKNVAQI